MDIENVSFISMKRCAEILDVSTRTIKRAVHAGKLKAFKVGPNKIRIREEDFKHYLNNLSWSHNMPQLKEKIKKAIVETQSESILQNKYKQIHTNID